MLTLQLYAVSDFHHRVRSETHSLLEISRNHSVRSVLLVVLLIIKNISNIRDYSDALASRRGGGPLSLAGRVRITNFQMLFLG